MTLTEYLDSIPQDVTAITGIPLTDNAPPHPPIEPGPLPDDMDKYRNLRYLHLCGAEDIQLTGTLPPSLGRCEHLIKITICHHPQLTGPIPPEYGMAMKEMMIL